MGPLREVPMRLLASQTIGWRSPESPDRVGAVRGRRFQRWRRGFGESSMESPSQICITWITEWVCIQSISDKKKRINNFRARRNRTNRSLDLLRKARTQTPLPGGGYKHLTPGGEWFWDPPRDHGGG